MKTIKCVSISVALGAILIATTASPFSASACDRSCCGQNRSPTGARHDHRTSQAALSVTTLASQPASTSAVKTALDNYVTIQSALAGDSMKNVTVSAQELAKAVRGDETKSLPKEIAEQADAVAKAKNLARARAAFKPLSESLIAYLKGNGASPETLYEVYCPIVKASWLQTGETVRNPYLGPRSAIPTWGWACSAVVKTKFERPSSSKG